MAGYEIDIRHGGGTAWTYVLLQGASTSYKDLYGLLPNTQYEWRLRTWCDMNGDNISGFTPMDTFTTLPSGSRLANTQKVEVAVITGIYPNPSNNTFNISLNLPDEFDDVKFIFLAYIN